MAQQSRLLRDNPSGFPYDFEKQILSKQSADTIYHWHPELEIIYVKKGTATLYINSERFESHEGDIFLIQPTSPHAIYSIENQEQISTVFRIHLDFLGRNQIDSFSQRYIQPLYSGHFYLTPRVSPNDHAYEQIRDCLFLSFLSLKNRVFTTISSLNPNSMNFSIFSLNTGMSIATIRMTPIKNTRN